MNFTNLKPSQRAVYIETYGCQMNVGDTEIVLSLLHADGWRRAETPEQADLILINTCSVREGAEQRIWGRIGEMRRHQRRGARVGVIGCMAERLKEELLSKGKVDIVAGPDAYRDLPALVERGGVNVELSRSETYDDIVPWRLEGRHSEPLTGGVEPTTSREQSRTKFELCRGAQEEGEHLFVRQPASEASPPKCHSERSEESSADLAPLTAFISIMRGCDNFCSYCVVPFTRGRERSRDPQTILAEARNLFAGGCREVTLLGQNVNSYSSPDMDFPDLLRAVAAISPLLRVRFATSHPKDLSDKLIETMAAVPNICPSIHLPAQSGSTRMLGLMNRKYTREWYLERLAAVRRAIPECSVTTDLIAGFCGETNADHADTLSLMREAGYDFAYMFKYSERPGTVAARRMDDDVPEEVKSARLQEIISLQNEMSLLSNQRDVGRRFEVLVEGSSRRRADQLTGRTPQNKTVVFDAPIARHSEEPRSGDVEPASEASPQQRQRHSEQPSGGVESASTASLGIGDYVTVEITRCTQATLFGRVVE